MSILLEKLKSYGVNTTETMARFLDDEELYGDCLKSFMDDESFIELENGLKTKDYELAFNSAHNLKGVAGNLGLSGLYVAVSNLVERLRAKNVLDLEKYFKNIMDEKAKIKKIL